MSRCRVRGWGTTAIGGTADIDVVDASKLKVVWEGPAEGELNDQARKNPQAGVDKVVTSWLRR